MQTMFKPGDLVRIHTPTVNTRWMTWSNVERLGFAETHLSDEFNNIVGEIIRYDNNYLSNFIVWFPTLNCYTLFVADELALF